MDKRKRRLLCQTALDYLRLLKNPEVKIKVGKPLPKPVTLAEIKASKLFADSPLVRQGRLSVVPLSDTQFAFLTASK